jgi:hypothetical protein
VGIQTDTWMTKHNTRSWMKVPPPYDQRLLFQDDISWLNALKKSDELVQCCVVHSDLFYLELCFAKTDKERHSIQEWCVHNGISHRNNSNIA